MTMQGLQAASAVVGLVLLAAAALVFLLDASRWAGALLALGVLAVSAALLSATRWALREIRTVKASLGRAVQDAGRADRTHRAASRDEADRLHRGLQSVDSRLDEVAAAAQLDTVQEDLTTLAGEVERLRDVPGLAVWQGLAGLRREGVHCLVMGPRDAAAILAAGDTDVSFEVCDPSGTTGPRVPTTPAHAVGSVLVDLDLLAEYAGADRPDGMGGTHEVDGVWETFLRWLRVEVPVAGFSRQPGQLAHRAAQLSRISGGVLLPAPATVPMNGAAPAGVRFVRRAGVPRGRPVEVTAEQEGGVR